MSAQAALAEVVHAPSVRIVLGSALAVWHISGRPPVDAAAPIPGIRHSVDEGRSRAATGCSGLVSPEEFARLGLMFLARRATMAYGFLYRRLS